MPLGRGNDQDAIREWERAHGARPPYGIFPPTCPSSLEFAAVAAQYARLVKSYDAAAATSHLAAAALAYAWAGAHPEAGAERTQAEGPPFRAWAAAELFRATGAARYNDEVVRLVRAGALTTKVHWKLAQFLPICQWPYAVCTRPGTDAQVRDALKAALIARADGIVRETGEATYRVGHNGKGSMAWGTGNGGGYYADPCLRAWWLTKEQRYFDAASLNADFQLGANPLSKTFITGMGVRCPVQPQISAFLYTGPNKTGTTVPGITVYGLADATLLWYPAEIPRYRRWRDLGNGGAESSSEFTITETIGSSALLYASLYALAGGF